MPKSMRSRTLNRRCQIARADSQGNPLRDEHGNYVLDYDGLWFFHVSGGDHHDRKRILPVDHEAFLQFYVDRINESLKRRGSARTVTTAEVYGELVQRCRKPSETYAPPGHPEEFSLVLNKGLCINWTHGFGHAAAAQPIAIEAMSFFANTLAGEGSTGIESTHTDAPAPDDGTNKRKGKQKLTLKDLGME
jgi:hypothetical protein